MDIGGRETQDMGNTGLTPMLSMSNAELLIHAFMTSRLDYCNALLGGCSARL